MDAGIGEDRVAEFADLQRERRVFKRFLKTKVPLSIEDLLQVTPEQLREAIKISKKSGFFQIPKINRNRMEQGSKIVFDFAQNCANTVSPILTNKPICLSLNDAKL